MKTKSTTEVDTFATHNYVGWVVISTFIKSLFGLFPSHNPHICTWQCFVLKIIYSIYIMTSGGCVRWIIPRIFLFIHNFMCTQRREWLKTTKAFHAFHLSQTLYAV